MLGREMMEGPESKFRPNGHMVLQAQLEQCIRGGPDGSFCRPIFHGASGGSNNVKNPL